MESHAVAGVASMMNTPFIAIRAIADPSDRALPPAALNAVAEDGSTDIPKTLVTALMGPSQFPALMKLGRDAARATKTLRRDAPELISKINNTTY